MMSSCMSTDVGYGLTHQLSTRGPCTEHCSEYAYSEDEEELAIREQERCRQIYKHTSLEWNRPSDNCTD